MEETPKELSNKLLLALQTGLVADGCDETLAILTVNKLKEGYDYIFEQITKQTTEKDQEIENLKDKVESWKASSEGFKEHMLTERKSVLRYESILGNYKTSHNSIMQLNQEHQITIESQSKRIKELDEEISLNLQLLIDKHAFYSDPEDGEIILANTVREFAKSLLSPPPPKKETKEDECDPTCHLHKYYKENGAKCCKLWRDTSGL